MLYKYHSDKIISSTNFVLCFFSVLLVKIVVLSMVETKTFPAENLLLSPFCDDSGKYFRSVMGISKKIFAACSSLLWYRKMLDKYHRNENISKTKFIACFFLVLLLKKVG